MRSLAVLLSIRYRRRTQASLLRWTGISHDPELGLSGASRRRNARARMLRRGSAVEARIDERPLLLALFLFLLSSPFALVHPLVATARTHGEHLTVDKSFHSAADARLPAHTQSGHKHPHVSQSPSRRPVPRTGAERTSFAERQPRLRRPVEEPERKPGAPPGESSSTWPLVAPGSPGSRVRPRNTFNFGIAELTMLEFATGA